MQKMSDLEASLLVFAITISLLLIYSIFDIRDRRIPNRVMLVGGIIGLAVTIISGHFYESLLLHLFSLLFTIVLSSVLFKLGAFGGADVKVLITVGIISPGFEFVIWINPIVEAIIAIGIETTIMLFLGSVWWYQTKKNDKGTQPPPLVPLLLLGYILVTIFATVAIMH
jgi:Flp pilus assembly protein protease CpaA